MCHSLVGSISTRFSVKFIANGPSIPDELLLARDQGRVVFFCGAGVSRARAGLPDFFGLAEKVTDKLGVQAGSAVVKILEEAKVIGNRTGVDGLISADRVFGLLEREFLPRDINAAVAAALNPGANCDLHAHRTLVRLATTREGLVRLVTTNFDRMFDECKVGLNSFKPPNLPDPARPSEMNGIVYLHGKATANYDGAEGDGFVLSSSEFGRAYLSDGWATSFFREIIDRYFVVFVGYTADDPPVQYLLEALNKTSGRLVGVYAFQSGEAKYATTRWQHKGVEAIPYDEAQRHSALWTTLEAWADRADDADGWTDRIVELAKQGPEKLEPYQRGQVAHVMGTVEGVRKFSEGENPPPATWLCVFDSYRRYEKPGYLGKLSDKGPYVDPFDLFGLDSDPVPNKLDPEDHYAKRETPSGAWSAFDLSKIDRLSLRDENMSSLRGHWAENIPLLSARLHQLGVWIAKISNQAAAVWWAARQGALHPDLSQKINWQLERGNDADASEVIRTAWRFLFDYWRQRHENFHHEWFQLDDDVEKNGWNLTIVRSFANAARPYIKVESSYWGGPVPPEATNELQLHDLIRLDVEYPDPPGNLHIPDEWLWHAVAHLRRNLEIAVELETEIGGFGLHNISPITPDEGASGDRYGRSHGLSAWVVFFVAQFKRLLETDVEAAVVEFNRWDFRDDTVFSRLRIWALGSDILVPSVEFGGIVAGLSDIAFWDSYHARDLLLSLSARWNHLDVLTRGTIEDRIVKGPSQWESEEEGNFRERRAWAVLNRLNWLEGNGCSLLLNVEAVTIRLRSDAPKWKPEYAAGEARSLEGRSGWVRTETEHSVLLKEPIGNVLAKALELSGRRGMEFIEYDPFAGLAQDRRVRAFAVLRQAAKNGDYPEWAWRKFLNSEARKTDTSRFTAFIACEIVSYPPGAIADSIRPAADWCQKSAKVLAVHCPDLFSLLIKKLATVLIALPPSSNSAIVRTSNERDWTMEAINSPTGDLAEALFDDPLKSDLEAAVGLPGEWREKAELLLSLPGDLRRHALVIFAYNLSWFYWVDPIWTKLNLLAALDAGAPEDCEALWAGFLWSGKAHGRELFAILKPHMLILAKSGDLEKRGHLETLTGMILSAWALIEKETGERWVSDAELRDVLLNSDDGFRIRVLQQAERWASEGEDGPTKWPPLIIHLLRDVWPRQIATKSPTVSARLCDLAFSRERDFVELAKIILPLLTKIEADHLRLPNLRRSRDNIVDLHPEQVLSLLYAVLPDSANLWPYGVDGTIARIGEADSALKGDERLLELRRVWDSR
nr:SIR2 family protein [Rhizobium leguminosarum]